MNARVLALTAIVAACGAPAPKKIELPAEALSSDVKTLVIAVIDGISVDALIADRATMDEAAVAADAPFLSAWDDTPASYVVAGYAEAPSALNLRPGLASKLTGATTLLPAPTLVRTFDVSTSDGWTGASALPALVAGFEVPAMVGPVDCEEAIVRNIGLDPTYNFQAVGAIDPDHALTLGRIGRADGQAHVFAFDLSGADAVARARPLEGDISFNVRANLTLASDGRTAWATDDNGKLLLLGRDGTLLAQSERGAAIGVVQSTDGRVFSWNAGGVSLLTRGSTVGSLVPTTSFPPDVIHLAVHDERRMVALKSDGAMVILRAGSWAALGRPVEDPNPLIWVGVDELTEYAITNGDAWLKDAENVWARADGERPLERRTFVPFGSGRFVSTGATGYLKLRPRAGSSDVCRPRINATRYLIRVTVDPTRKAVFTIDSIEEDQGGSLLVRVAVPR